MNRMIFVNLPVTDLEASRRFYTGLGFTVNEDFCDEKVACIVISETIFVMLLHRDRFADFTTREIADARTSTQVINALAARDRDEVDQFVERAVSHGGTLQGPVEEGAMYGFTVADPDGHLWEVFYMDAPG
ncbi:VOC family protein [Cellulomonas bogoriensis]|uniref:Glyoxalase n=1 Tax=Cellulomonas bogoriensis 69B4 = DSM 16987 TaxID=1386082 RepID=A0A0A0C1P7_9CELL|nr:VOC family protein [Cellulomonas bogoriensis]KGM14105.1 glyoxalase [Cellulomonas bogoriensis 69B4 = DSM 16987]